MIKTPFFSIIIPTYNSIKVLDAAVNSIIPQTYKDYEIVFIDGESTDGTLELIKDYKEKYTDVIRYISEPDQGIYDAMNKGVNYATGKWVYFLGSDDYLLNDCVLENILAHIEKETDFIYGNTIWNSSVVGEAFSKSTLVYKNITHQAIFYKRELFDKLSNYNLEFKVWADYEFNLRCFGDDSINKKYVNLNIAQFSLGGFSSQESIDKLFCKNALVLFNRTLKVEEDKDFGNALELFAKNEINNNFLSVGIFHLFKSTLKTGRVIKNLKFVLRYYYNGFKK